ncbi:enoyl-CoA hydratase-related protein [uncultured Abyssibacter sp.]|uniref:enoyl-CoA hydratase-related protein n=1 Tax=uncultured Abyssibacter sp. TaxID=2320202 RepID=UPI0032B30A38
MDYETLLVRREGRVAIIAMNRPKMLNAMSVTMTRELNQAFDAAAGDDEVTAILLTGEGRAFSAGADVGGNPAELPKDESGRLDLGAPLEESYNPLIRSMRATPKPVVAAVNGLAAGAGAGVALAADLTVAARSAYFLQAFVNIGLMPDAGCTYTLSQAVGPQRAMGMAMLGEKISAEQAQAWGLIWDVMDDENFMESAMALVTRLSLGPLKALAHIKRAIHAGETGTMDQQLEMERDLQRECGQTQDFMEGAMAFVQKRAPKFTGR